MSKTPVLLFTYNRPLHTQKVLDSLALNEYAKETKIYIFQDGKKANATEQDILNIKEVSRIINNEKRFKEVIIEINDINKGLSNSIIDGVNRIIEKHDSVIVLEDDIVVNKGFLRYMNDALTMYQEEDKVGCIHAWNYNLDITSKQETTFFLKGADCWGWGTWGRAWKLFNENGIELLNEIKERGLTFHFDRNGTHQYTQMLQEQIDGKINSWAIRWHASLFLKEKYCLQPTQPIVKNIGFDGSGTHCGAIQLNEQTVENINLNKIEIKESLWFFKEYEKLNLKNKKKITTLKDRLNSLISKLISNKKTKKA